MSGERGAVVCVCVCVCGRVCLCDTPPGESALARRATPSQSWATGTEKGGAQAH